MTVYKLTTQDCKTRAGKSNETTWGEGVERTASGEGDLCGPGWLHAYEDPLVAVFMNPVHANLRDPVLWECDGDVGKRDGEQKCGCTRLKTLVQIPMPQITIDQRVEVAIRMARAILKQLNVVIEKWEMWADGWLDWSDRSAAANAAAYSAAYAANAAADYAATAAANGKVSLISILREVCGVVRVTMEQALNLQE
jgi:hypothetical protein